MMRRKALGVFLLVGIFASLGGVAYKVVENFWQMKAREIKREPGKFLDQLPEAVLQIKEFRRAKIDHGQKIWELSGEEAHYLKTDKQVVVKRPRMIFYQKDQNAIEATGDSGRLWFSSENGEMEKAQLEGKVQVNYRGFVLNSDEIVFFESKNRVILPGKVSIKSDGMELEGNEMEISLDDEKMRMLNKVKTRIEPEQLKTMGARVDGKKKKKP